MMKTEKVIELNNYLSSVLGEIKDIKINHNKDMIYKIIHNVLKNYLKNFSDINGKVDGVKYKSYLNEITDYIESNFENIESYEFLLGLHYHIMQKLTLEKTDRNLIGNIRNKTKNIFGAGIDGKIKQRGFLSPKFIKKELKNNIKQLNESLKNGDKNKQFNSIIYFILYSLFKIHPFDNGNSKVFYIYLDLLLLKYDFFPVFIRHENYYNDILEVFKSYTPSFNLTKLKNNFIDYIIVIYSNYKM